MCWSQRVSLRDSLESLADPGTTMPQVTGAPSGWEPGVRYEPDGSRTVTLPPSPALADEASWAAAIAALGVDIPDGYRVRLVEAKYDPQAWTRETPYSVHPATSVEHKTPAVTRPVWRYRFVVEVAPARIDVDELLRAIKPRKAAGVAVKGADLPAFVFTAGDLQLGKPDGDGTEGTVQRFLDSLDRALARYKVLRKRGQCGPVLLAWVGDCIEGTQASNPSTRADLTLTEQVRVYRRLMAEQVAAFAAAADSVHVAVVPGNHDDAFRMGKGPAYRYDDSWAIEGASQVADVMAAKGYDVAWTFPDKDGMHLTVQAAGSRIGLLHGHQTKGKMETWLAQKALSRDAIGTADVCLSGHFHHLRVTQLGPTCWMQTGALDGGSSWWTHGGGLSAPPAALTFVTAGGSWSGLEVV